MRDSVSQAITTKATQGPAYGPLVSVTAEGHAEQDGTPTPSDPKGIVVVRGRNLLDGDTESVTLASEGRFYPYRATKLQAGKTYTVSFESSINSGAWQVIANNAAGPDGETILASVSFATAKTATFTPAQDFSYLTIYSNTAGTFKSIQLELGSTVHPYVPYGHVGLEIDAKLTPNNLLRNGGTGLIESNPAVTSYVASVAPNTSYTLTYEGGNRCYVSGCGDKYPQAGDTASSIYGANSAVNHLVFNSGSNRYVLLHLATSATVTNVRLISTTPIPLPSRGWVGSLPDGTHDALSIDGAGKVTWELACGEVELSTLTWNYGSNRQRSSSLISEMKPQPNGNIVFNALAESLRPMRYSEGLSTNHDGIAIDTNQPVLITYAEDSSVIPFGKLLYTLATPTTEDAGYIDLPDIPDGAVVSMPELEGLGVESWTSDAVARYVRAWAARQ